MFEKVFLTACLLSSINAAYRGPLAGGLPAALYPAGIDPRTCPNFPDCSNPAVAASQAFQLSSPYQAQQSAQTHQAIYQPRLAVTRAIYQPRLTVTPVVQPEFEYVPSSARTQQYTVPQQYTPQPQYVAAPRQQVAPPQPYAPIQRQRIAPSPQYSPPQQFAPAQQYAPPQRQQYSPPQQFAPPAVEQQYTPEQQRALNRGEYIGDGDYHGEGLAEALAPEYQGQQQSYQQRAAPAAVQSRQNNTPAYQKVSAFLAQSQQNVRQTPTTKECRNYPYC